ncbi:hypothetical protein [Streptomyces sp. NBC_01803]|uniref:hypothetical protein n=1 Tax=Streptomyces sp. NBC_01803 TaxID=2975946 RepID=UPI002DDAB133|nr:hypothetical protein [Streptomyces sp. NBC_01803]WSA46332.1 hypothetical protein OIE51_20360 [Streptomyces sp. NBC_01803]
MPDGGVIPRIVFTRRPAGADPGVIPAMMLGVRHVPLPTGDVRDLLKAATGLPEGAGPQLLAAANARAAEDPVAANAEVAHGVREFLQQHILPLPPDRRQARLTTAAEISPDSHLYVHVACGPPGAVRSAPDHRTGRTVVGAIGGGSVELPLAPQYRRVLARPDAGGAMEFLARLLRIKAGDVLAYNARRYRDDEPYDGLVQLGAHGIAEIAAHTVHAGWWGTAHVWRVATTPFHAAAAGAIGCFIDSSPLPGATRRLPTEAQGRFLVLTGFGGPPGAEPAAVGCVIHPALARACGTLDAIAEEAPPAEVVARQHQGPLYHAAAARMPRAARLNEGAARLLHGVTGGLLAQGRAGGEPVSPFDRPGAPAVAYELPSPDQAAGLAALPPERIENALVDASPVPMPTEPPGLLTPTDPLDPSLTRQIVLADRWVPAVLTGRIPSPPPPPPPPPPLAGRPPGR